MSNVYEPLHHRNKWIAYGYLQAIAIRIVLCYLGLHGCSTAGGWRTLSRSSVTCTELGKSVFLLSCIGQVSQSQEKPNEVRVKNCGESERFRVMRKTEVWTSSHAKAGRLPQGNSLWKIVELYWNEETAKERGESRVCFFSQAQHDMEKHWLLQMRAKG